MLSWAQNADMKIAERSSRKFLQSPNTCKLQCILGSCDWQEFLPFFFSMATDSPNSRQMPDIYEQGLCKESVKQSKSSLVTSPRQAGPTPATGHLQLH